MKKIMILSMVLISAIFLTACGSANETISSSDNAGKTGDSAAKVQNDAGRESGKAQGKNLVVYFSHSGNTQMLAELIHQKVGGDIFRIKTVNPYPEDYDECVKVAKKEQENNARPALENRIENMDAYDTIFIGYPNWWGTMPMAMFTFLEEYNFTGKKIVPFCTNEGSGLGRSASDIANICSNSTVLEGLAVRGSDAKAGNAAVAVEKWLRDLEMLK